MAQNVSPERPDDESGREEQEEQKDQPENKVDDDRESIWTIPAKLKRWYFALFSIQVVIAAIWLVRMGIVDEGRNGIPDILFYVWQYMAPAAVSSATFALVIVDTAKGVMVLSTWLEDELKKRRERQIKAAVEAAVKVAVEAAVKEARAEARAEALSEERQRWEQWNRRREAAEAAGEQFNEPPPGVNQESEDLQQK